MDISEKLSNRITDKIKKTSPGKTEIELEQIKYGLHILFSNFIKLPIIFLISYFFAILPYVLISLAGFSFVRIFASGIHARKSITCLISTGMILIGTACAGLNFSLSILDITATFLTCFIITYSYAPADTEEKPFVSKRLRKKMKLLSCISIIILYLICLLFSSTKYASITTFAVLAECISILPITYMIFRRRYNNYEAYNN